MEVETWPANVAPVGSGLKSQAGKRMFDEIMDAEAWSTRAMTM